MKGLYTLFALFALIAFAAASDVVVLDSDNFDEVVSENYFVFVEFYAPWCGHCKRLAPDYETLATELKGEESPAVVAKVDATEATAVASQYGVRGYPTLIFFRNGNQIKYEGDRSVAAMKTFINKKSGPPTKHLTTKEDIENFVGVVAYVESFNADSGAAFIDAAIEDKYENYMKSEPIPENNDGPLTVLVGKNFKQIVTESKDEVFVEFYAPWCGHCKKLAPVWEELAETFEDVDHVKIAKIDATNNNLPNDINVRGYPTLIWFNANGEQVPYSGERDLKSSLTSLSPSPRRRSTSTR